MNAWVFPVIARSGHHYEVRVSPIPFDGHNVLDPCDGKCKKVFDLEMEEIGEMLKDGLELVRKKK